MLDYNLLNSIFVIVALVILIRFVFPLYKDRKSIYKDVKAGLLLFGYAFRDDKIKAIADMLLSVVLIVEEMDAKNAQKQHDAITIAYEKLLQEFDIVLDIEVMSLLVDIAVSYIPKTEEV